MIGISCLLLLVFFFSGSAHIRRKINTGNISLHYHKIAKASHIALVRLWENYFTYFPQYVFF